MSLILAVEPDRRQAKQLSALVQKHVRGELVVADSGAAALKALGDRIPDLILTPALLPPKDEAVLTGWLRDMGDGAAHVQTLAIPILAEPSSGRGRESQGSSIFGRMRDQQQENNPGCDPKVFADQVKVYLDRAGVERSSREPQQKSAAPVVKMAAAAEERAPEIEEFDDAMTFEDLVFEPGPTEPIPVPAPVPVAEPPVVKKTPTPFARPEKRVDPSMLKSWESELGLDSASTTAAPPLWRVDAQSDSGPATARTIPSDLAFDPGDARYAPLFRRLDELAAQHA
jgi:CheY-like chemotaxis protein